MSTKRKVRDLFVPVVPEARLHPLFTRLRTWNGDEPARLIMNRVYADLPDSDGNFAEQFQTTGFDARTFELYLYAYLASSGYKVRRDKPIPDFIVTRSGVTCAIEATTANPSGGIAPRKPGQLRRALSPEALRKKRDNELPIRFGSPLKSKLDMRYDGRAYWELEHCKGMPFVIAIEAFHEAGSLFFSDAALRQYLYGLKSPPRWTEAGKLVLDEVKIEKHRHRGKVIPSNFFAQPGTEHISAVLFSNSGIAPKFNRMGYQAGYHRGNILMFRRGQCFNSDDLNSVVPKEFGYDLDFPPCEETWGQGLVVFHNPNAERQLPRYFFKNAVTHYVEGGKLTTDVPDVRLLPFASVTVISCLDDGDLDPVTGPRPGLRSIRLDEFEALGPPRPSRTLPVSQEKEWFASEGPTDIRNRSPGPH